MEKLKTFGSLFLAMLRCFILGGYSYATVRGLETIEPRQWIITTLFGLMFLGFFLVDYRKK